MPYDKVNEFTKGTGPIYEVDSIEFAFKSIAGIPNGVQVTIDELYSVNKIVVSGDGAIENLEWNNNVLDTVKRFVIKNDFTGSSFKNGLPKSLADLERLKALSLEAEAEYFTEDPIRELMSRYISNCVVTTIISEKVLKMAICAITRPEANWQKETEIDYNGDIFYLNPSCGHFAIDIYSENQLKAECFDDLQNLKSIKIEAMSGVIDEFDIFVKMFEKSVNTLEHLIILNVKSANYEDTLCTIAANISSIGGAGKSFEKLKTLSISTALITEAGMNGLLQPVRSLLRKQIVKFMVSFIPFETSLERHIIPVNLQRVDDWRAFKSRTIVGYTKSRISRRAKAELLKGNPPEWVLSAIHGLRI